MALDRELDEAVAELRVGDPAGLEQLRVDAGLGEAGHRVDLVDQHLAVGLDEEVAAGEAGAAGEGEDRGGELADARRSSAREIGAGTAQLHAALAVLGLEVVPLGVGDDLARQRGLRAPRCRAPSTRPRGRWPRPRRSPAGRGAGPARPPRRGPSRSLDPGDADARADPRGLDPERQPQLARSARASPSSPTAANSTWGIAARGEEPLQGQLVHADRRGEHVGADVGDVEPLQQPLDAAVLAEGAVQGREDGVGAEQAARRGSASTAAPSPSPARRRGRSSPRPPRGRRLAARAATEAPERSETSCSEERPPERTATLTVLLLLRAIGAAARLPTTIVTSVARFELGAGRRELVDRRGRPCRRLRFLLLRRSGRGRLRAAACTASRAQLADHVRHLRLLLAGGDDDRDGRARLRPRCRRSATG